MDTSKVGEKMLRVQRMQLIVRSKARKVWKEYYAGADAIVFLCDAAARDRFDESKKELDVRFRTVHKHES